MKDKTTERVILKCKINLSRFGIPLEVINENGPQFAAVKLKKFSDEYNFTHEIICSGNSKTNLRAEAAVNIAKNMLIKSKKNVKDHLYWTVEYSKHS